MGKAHEIRITRSNSTGIARLYRLEPPRMWEGRGEFEYVILSTVVDQNVAETLILASDAHGEIRDWWELGGAFDPTVGDEEVLKAIGYTTEDRPQIGSVEFDAWMEEISTETRAEVSRERLYDLWADGYSSWEAETLA